jgi:hypothetical protein
MKPTIELVEAEPRYRIELSEIQIKKLGALLSIVADWGADSLGEVYHAICDSELGSDECFDEFFTASSVSPSTGDSTIVALPEITSK